MWAPWRTSFLAGAVAGCASIWPQRDSDILYLVTLTGTLVIVVALLTRLGLRLSGRALLPSKAAVTLLVAIAIVGFLSAQPIETHAVVVDLPSANTSHRDSMLGIYLFGIATLAAPALMSFAIARFAGVPPNNSLERTREG